MRFGGKNVLAFSMLVASLMTIVTPFAARWHYAALFVNRFLIGLAHVNFRSILEFVIALSQN